MGVYLNPGAGKYERALRSEIYVDKTDMISFLNARCLSEQSYLCVSRPRRFGKSMTANMISAYYDRTVDQKRVFHGLKIANLPDGMQNAGKFDVIKLNMQEFLSRTDSMTAMLERLKSRVLEELQEAYPQLPIGQERGFVESQEKVFAATGRYFVIILDEWDCIFREQKNHKEEQEQYLDFLRDWIKDKEYIALAYMTGILPVKKYGTHSALNMFEEFSMEHPDQLASYVGFTEAETRELCEKYHMDFEECQAWYDGYSFPQEQHVYNPKSVVEAMTRHRFGSYWNNTETYEALKVYIDRNEDGLRDAVVRMMGGSRERVDTTTFQNDMTTFSSADDVLTLLVHLGYLGYDSDSEKVFIPNNEVLREYVTATKNGDRWNCRSVKALREGFCSSVLCMIRRPSGINAR